MDTMTHPPTVEASPAHTGVRVIGVDEMKRTVASPNGAVIVMAMDDRRFAMAHIDGSISFDTLQRRLPTLDRSTRIVLYCTHAGCAASKIRAEMLAEDGFAHVERFAGGLAEWEAAGLAIHRGPADGSSAGHRPA